MARHPGLVSRQIPFVILANKKDKEGAINHHDMYKILQIDRLKSMNDLKYSIVATEGNEKIGVDDAF